MLLQFNVTNVLSFKDEAILDLVAGADDSHEENLIKFDKNRVLPTVAIYGANASGKSNLIKAMTRVILFVRLSNYMQINQKIDVIPFLFDEKSKNGRFRFDFVFIHNEIKYEYGFVADTVRVYEEYLYEYTSAKPSMIFERYDVDKYNYTTLLKGRLEQYAEKNTENKLFLATATAWNCKETRNAFLWFAEAIDTYDQETVVNNMAEQLEDSDSYEMKEFLTQLLKQADFNISDYNFSVKTKDVANINITLPPGMKLGDSAISGVTKEWKLDMIHEIDKNGERKRYLLPYHDESNGTQQFFAYAPFIYKALKSGKTVVVDEIDNGIHPMLIQYIVEIFNDKTINKNGAQLIFNTHDISLLDLDVFRRDQIYFVEKNNKTGQSELYPLADFSPRKTDKIQKKYMQGRYGAVPNIEIGELRW